MTEYAMRSDTDKLLDRDELTYGLQMKRRSPYKVYLLGLATLGVYWVVWFYKVNRELQDFDARIPGRPAVSALAFSLGWPLVVPQFLAFFRTGHRIERAQHAAGCFGTADALTGLLLWVCGGVGVIYYQAELNRVVDRYGAPADTEVFHYA
jgi:hypothetical protein